MKRIDIQSIEQWERYFDSDELIATYKHSTRCGVSSMAWGRLERGWNSDVKVLFIDLIRFRDLSNYIAQKTGVRHESPQIIVSRNGEVLDYTSHMQISADWMSKVEEKAMQI
jgi:bacillithiol system protein YtxJ